MKKWWIAFLCVFSLAAFAFAGCAKDDNKGKNSNSESDYFQGNDGDDGDYTDNY